MEKLLESEQQNSLLQTPKAEWWLYVLSCADESFYTGITNNLAKRLQSHKTGKASKYTRSRLPVELKASIQVGCNRGTAQSLEISFKKLTRKEKEYYVDVGLDVFLDKRSYPVNS